MLESGQSWAMFLGWDECVTVSVRCILTNDDLVFLKDIGGDLQVEGCWSLANTARDVVVRSVARAVPTAKVSSLANGDTSQVGADTQHDKPLGLLDAISIILRVTELRDADRVGLCNLISSAVSDEDGLSTPLDGDIAAFGDGGKRHLDLGQSQHISRSGHVGQEVRDS